jgi:hypothetical protein
MQEFNEAQEILRIVAHIATNPGAMFPRRGFSEALYSLRHEAFESHSLNLFLTLIGVDIVESIVATLPNVMHVSQILRVPAVNLLMGDVHGVNFDLLQSRVPMKSEHHRFHRGPWRNRLAVQAEASSYFESSTDGLRRSMAAVAQHVGMSPSGFTYLCPDLASHIVETYRREVLQRRADLRLTLSKRINELISFPPGAGQMPLGRKRLTNKLWKERRWPKNAIREEVQRAFDAIEGHSR